MDAAVIAVAAIPGALAFAGVVLLARRNRAATAAGIVIVVAAGFVPFLFAYGWAVAAAGGAAGACAAAVWSGRPVGWTHRAVLAAAVVVVAAEPVLTFNGWEIYSNETYDRCAAEKAVAAIELSRASGRGYPADMGEIALADGEYGDACYVSRGVNWLYRVAAPGTYTIGYWVDWRFARRVCLHTARSSGWSCGFEAWGPFRTGEVD